MSNKIVIFLLLINIIIYSSSNNDFTGFSPLNKPDVIHLNGGPLTQEQDELVDRMNSLLSTPSQTTLPEVYNTWHQLKNTFPSNIAETINDWEKRRDELLRPVLDQLSEIVHNSSNPSEIKNFDEFFEASTSISSGENIPNITLTEYAVLQEQSFNHLSNYSDIYMNVISNLSNEFSNRSYVQPDAREWFGNLSALGPEVNTQLNETYSDLCEQLNNFKNKLDETTANIRHRVSEIWKKTKEFATNFKNNTAEWLNEEHPEVVTTWQNVKNKFQNFGNSVKNTWNNFIDLFRTNENN